MSESTDVNILYMEDDTGLARILQKKLERRGFKIDLASDGEEGIMMLRKSAYDILLLDYHMPVLDGIGVVEKLSSDDALPPTIMLTGQGDESLVLKAMKLGVSDYIVKDFGMAYVEKLPQVIEHILKKESIGLKKSRVFTDMQKKKRLYRQVIELSPHGIAVDLEERLELINHSAAALLGITKLEDLQKEKFIDFVNPDQKGEVEESLYGSNKENERRLWKDIVLNRLDGSGLTVDLITTPFISDAGRAVQYTFYDNKAPA